MGELKGKKIRIHCTLNDKKGVFIAAPESVLRVGDDVDETIAQQLLAGGSATLLSERTGGTHV